MFLHELKPTEGSKKRRKIVGRGRGSGHGKTSCRGQKGQGARSGRGILNILEGGQIPLARRLPKVGFNSKSPILNQVVNVNDLNRFEKSAVVNAESLKAKGLIQSLNKPFKILGCGEIKKSLTVQVQSISKAAQEKVVKAGGKVEIVEKNLEKKETAPKK